MRTARVHATCFSCTERITIEMAGINHGRPHLLEDDGRWAALAMCDGCGRLARHVVDEGLAFQSAAFREARLRWESSAARATCRAGAEPDEPERLFIEVYRTLVKATARYFN